jgi:hypothetical protein
MLPIDPHTVKSTFAMKDVPSIARLDGKVTSKGALEYAVMPSAVTVIGAYVAPAGTVTASDVEVASFTTALTAPK